MGRYMDDRTARCLFDEPGNRRFILKITTSIQDFSQHPSFFNSTLQLTVT